MRRDTWLLTISIVWSAIVLVVLIFPAVI